MQFIFNFYDLIHIVFRNDFIIAMQAHSISIKDKNLNKLEKQEKQQQQQQEFSIDDKIIQDDYASQHPHSQIDSKKKQKHLKKQLNTGQLIQTLIKSRSLKRIPMRNKTLKQFKQTVDNNDTKKTRQFISFVEPQFFIRTLFQAYSNTIKMNQVKYYSSSKKGIRNFQTLENQDVLLMERIANVYKIFGVFDGHGIHGKTVAHVCSAYFKSCLKSFEEQFKREISDTQIVQIIKSSIKKTQAYLINYKYNQIQFSGTTALIVLVSTRTIFTFNIGNSRLVIAMEEDKSDKIYDFQVTNDHDLGRLDERYRIKQTGALISPLKDSLGESFGPDRIWLKNQKKPGTSITRALGLSCGTKAGIISQPEISVLSYNRRMKFLVIASDGLWLVQENDEVIEYLQRYYRLGQLNMGVPALMEQAVNRWKTKSELMDDISIIVVTLSQQK